MAARKRKQMIEIKARRLKREPGARPTRPQQCGFVERLEIARPAGGLRLAAPGDGHAPSLKLRSSALIEPGECGGICSSRCEAVVNGPFRLVFAPGLSDDELGLGFNRINMRVFRGEGPRRGTAYLTKPILEAGTSIGATSARRALAPLHDVISRYPKIFYWLNLA